MVNLKIPAITEIQLREASDCSHPASADREVNHGLAQATFHAIE